MVKEGMPGPEHVKKWAIRGGLASMEGKYVDLDSSEHGAIKVAAW